jgi:hypothetical protein
MLPGGGDRPPGSAEDLAERFDHLPVDFLARKEAADG